MYYDMQAIAETVESENVKGIEWGTNLYFFFVFFYERKQHDNRSMMAEQLTGIITWTSSGTGNLLFHPENIQLSYLIIIMSNILHTTEIPGSSLTETTPS
jgi:hypothetical protein